MTSLITTFDPFWIVTLPTNLTVSKKWPAQSPDLNIIEKLSSYQEIYSKYSINSPLELFTAIQDIWMNFTVDYIQSLHSSIPHRILPVIRSKVYLTKHGRLLISTLCISIYSRRNNSNTFTFAILFSRIHMRRRCTCTHIPYDVFFI